MGRGVDRTEQHEAGVEGGRGLEASGKNGLQRRRLSGGCEAGELGLEVGAELRGFLRG